MKNKASIALATALLFAGVSGASAANSMSNSGSMSKTTTTSATANGQLSLSSEQQKTLWKDISADASKQNPPADFSAKVGAVVPSTITTKPLPAKAASDVPAARSYNYAMLNSKILLVNPSDHKVAEVITQ